MIVVHYIASNQNIANNLEDSRQVAKAISEEGHKLASEWVERVYRERVQEKKLPDWSYVYKANLELITKSDVLIADTTYNSFGVGYQVAVAVQQRKPVLLLRHDEAKTDAFATGVVDSWVEKASYNKDNVAEIVKKFLKENDIANKDMRFNFFIDRQIYNYLRWASFKTGKTKAEILRDLVTKEIEGKEDY